MNKFTKAQYAHDFALPKSYWEDDDETSGPGLHAEEEYEECYEAYRDND
jgi:hypothetical protein